MDITVTRVNSEIWQSLNSFRKKADLRLATLQQAFQKATFATLTNADKLLHVTDLSGPSKKELLTNSIDIVALLGHAASEISLLRREQMKPALKPEFHALCSSETKASAKFLFGEDLAKQVRDVKETHRIGNTVGSSNGHSRGYRRDSWSAKKGNPQQERLPLKTAFFGEGHATEQSQENTLPEERQPCREEIMRSLEQIKLSLIFPASLLFLFVVISKLVATIFGPDVFRILLTPGVG